MPSKQGQGSVNGGRTGKETCAGLVWACFSNLALERGSAIAACLLLSPSTIKEKAPKVRQLCIRA
jgi:hypothetical protein